MHQRLFRTSKLPDELGRAMHEELRGVFLSSPEGMPSNGTCRYLTCKHPGTPYKIASSLTLRNRQHPARSCLFRVLLFHLSRDLPSRRGARRSLRECGAAKLRAALHQQLARDGVLIERGGESYTAVPAAVLCCTALPRCSHRRRLLASSHSLALQHRD